MAKVCENTVSDYLTANFTEDEIEWNPNGVYNYKDEARFGHFIYKYAGEDGTNTTDNPEIENEDVLGEWVQDRPTNYFSMLDGANNTSTFNNESIDITVSSVNNNTISLLKLQGASVYLEVESDGNVVYSNMVSLADERDVYDEVSYWYEPFTFKTSLYLEDLPFVTNGILRIQILNAGAVAGCGNLIHGRNYTIGETLYNSNLSLESYSRKIADEFGKVNLVPVNSVNLDTHEILIATDKIPQLRRKMKELDAVPILFIMDESETSNTENLLNFGYWETFNMTLTNPSKSIINLTVKGLL